MPQADLKYSADLDIDAVAMLAAIEAVIQAHDAGAGGCKGRAYPTQAFHHTHIMLEVAVLDKPHRDGAYMQALLTKLTRVVDAGLSQSCARSVSLTFISKHYETGQYSA